MTQLCLRDISVHSLVVMGTHITLLNVVSYTYCTDEESFSLGSRECIDQKSTLMAADQEFSIEGEYTKIIVLNGIKILLEIW